MTGVLLSTWAVFPSYTPQPNPIFKPFEGLKWALRQYPPHTLPTPPPFSNLLRDWNERGSIPLTLTPFPSSFKKNFKRLWLFGSFSALFSRHWVVSRAPKAMISKVILTLLFFFLLIRYTGQKNYNSRVDNHPVREVKKARKENTVAEILGKLYRNNKHCQTRRITIPVCWVFFERRSKPPSTKREQKILVCKTEKHHRGDK